MPSGGLTPIDDETARKVADIANDAVKHGMLIDWLAYYTGGIKDGVEPVKAAWLAAVEWDF